MQIKNVLTWLCSWFRYVVTRACSVLNPIRRTTFFIFATAEASLNTKLNTKRDISTIFNKANATAPCTNNGFVWNYIKEICRLMLVVTKEGLNQTLGGLS